jgi:hypothetical protein
LQSGDDVSLAISDTIDNLQLPIDWASLGTKYETLVTSKFDIDDVLKILADSQLVIDDRVKRQEVPRAHIKQVLYANMILLYLTLAAQTAKQQKTSTPAVAATSSVAPSGSIAATHVSGTHVLPLGTHALITPPPGPPLAPPPLAPPLAPPPPPLAPPPLAPPPSTVSKASLVKLGKLLALLHALSK